MVEINLIFGLTITLFVSAILVFVLGTSDRLRGDKKDLVFGIKLFDKMAYASTMCLLVALWSLDLTLLAGIFLGMVAGMSPGWGEPLGATFDRRPMNPMKLEWWQYGSLKTNHLHAMIGRGFLWSLLIFVSYVLVEILVPVFLSTGTFISTVWTTQDFYLAIDTFKEFHFVIPHINSLVYLVAGTYTVAFPAAVYVARSKKLNFVIPYLDLVESSWEFSEFLRGVFAGIIFVAGMLIAYNFM